MVLNLEIVKANLRKMEKEMTFLSIGKIIVQRWWIVVVIPLLFVLVTALLSIFVMTPMYQSSSQVLINRSNVEYFNKTEIDTSKDLMETYSLILKSPAIFDVVEKNLGFSINESNIRVNGIGNSQLMKIIVEDSNPKQAAQIVNEIATVFKQEINRIMKLDNVVILTRGSIEENPAKPIVGLNIIISFIVGVIISLFVVFLLHYLDTTIKSEEEIEEDLGVNVLGTVLKLDTKQNSNQYYIFKANQ